MFHVRFDLFNVLFDLFNVLFQIFLDSFNVTFQVFFDLLILPIIKLCGNDFHVITEEAEMVNSMRTLSNNQIIDFDLELSDLEDNNNCLL